MCRLKSAIVLKDRIYCPLDEDSHEKMIDELKLNDKTMSPEFVRVEMSPYDGDIFNHDLKNWVLKVDQDFRPDWFSEKQAESEMKSELKKFFSERFLMDKKVKEIKEGRWFGKNCEIGELCGNSQVGELCGNSQVGVLCGNSKVGVLRENSQVGELCGNSKVGVLRENSQVSVLCGNSKVGVLRENSQVGELCGNSQVGELRENSQVGELWGNSKVGVLRENSQVGVLRENSKVGVLCGNSQVGSFSKDAEIKSIKENGIAILYYTEHPKILVANKKIKLVQFKSK